MCLAHLRKRPRCRRYHSLLITRLSVWERNKRDSGHGIALGARCSTCFSDCRGRNPGSLLHGKRTSVADSRRKEPVSLTLAPSLARSQTRRPYKSRRFVPGLPKFILVRRNLPMRDQWSALRSFMRPSKTSSETPRNSWPMITSGSDFWIVTISWAGCRWGYTISG